MRGESADRVRGDVGGHDVPCVELVHLGGDLFGLQPRDDPAGCLIDWEHGVAAAVGDVDVGCADPGCWKTEPGRERDDVGEQSAFASPRDRA